MPIPSVNANEIFAALVRFDAELRSTPQWTSWEENQAHRFAVRKDDKLYPVKQIIAMATGAPVSSFSGGSEANNYLRDRGFDIELLHLPTETETRVALHELLLERTPNTITPQEAYGILAERFRLTSRLRTQLMENSNEIHWENRVRFARRKLVDAGLLDGSEQGVWRLRVRDKPCVWVEKVFVEGRPDRQQGEYALGKALWSPKRNRSGDDDYGAMRQVQPGDFIVHIIDKGNVAGVSKVASYVETNFHGLPETAWTGVDAYLVRLTDFRPCEPPLS
jgi:hypothetical protein